jgi:hypothetical protein
MSGARVNISYIYKNTMTNLDLKSITDILDKPDCYGVIIHHCYSKTHAPVTVRQFHHKNESWMDTTSRFPGVAISRDVIINDHLLPKFKLGFTLRFNMGDYHEYLEPCNLHFFREIDKFILQADKPYDWFSEINRLYESKLKLEEKCVELNDKRKAKEHWRRGDEHTKDYISTIKQKIQLYEFKISMLEEQIDKSYELYKHVIMPQENRKLMRESSGMMNCMRRNSL